MSQAKTLLIHAWSPVLAFVALLGLLPATFPSAVQAQKASVSLSASNLEYYGFVNGGGIEIGSNAGLNYAGSLNMIAKSRAVPIVMSVNDVVIMNGTPERMEKMNKQDSIYQHKLDPDLAKSTIEISDQNSLAVRIGGTMATYRGLMSQSQKATSHSAMGRSLSVFPSVFPSVFSQNVGQ